MRTRPGHNSRDGVSQLQETTPLFLPWSNLLHETYIGRGEDTSNVVVPVIPTQNRVTEEIISQRQVFEDLRQTCVVSRRAEQLCLRTEPWHRIVTTVEDSVFGTEMGVLESQEEDDPG